VEYNVLGETGPLSAYKRNLQNTHLNDLKAHEQRVRERNRFPVITTEVFCVRKLVVLLLRRVSVLQEEHSILIRKTDSGILIHLNSALNMMQNQ
jgi:hypothetical protein